MGLNIQYQVKPSIGTPIVTFKPMCGDFYLSYPAVGRTLEVILTPDNDCVYCTAISLVFTTLINMSSKQIPLHLLHLWINAIQMVTLFTFTAFNILDIHDKACSRSSTLTFTTRVCVCSHTPPCSPVHETRAAALNVSINHP